MSSESDNAVHGAHREEAGTLTQHQLDGSLGFHEGHGSMGISGVRINEPKAVDLEKITEGLQKTSLQRQRLHNFDYQAYSLPVSRVSSSDFRGALALRRGMVAHTKYMCAIGRLASDTQCA